MNIIVKRNFFVGLMVVCAMFFNSKLFAEQDTIEEETQAAIVLINHVNWVLNTIRENDNVAILELEYENLSIDKLNLATIKDQEVIDQIVRIYDYITSRRISLGERELLKYELEFNKKNAIYESFNPPDIIAASPSAIAFNLAQSTFSTYMNYRKTMGNLQLKYKRDTWELDKDDMLELNGLNSELLQQQWSLVQNHRLDDYWRTSEEDIKILLERINSSNSKRDTFEFLNHDIIRKRYQKLPAFWYYLGEYARQTGNKEVAIEAFDRYQKEFCQIMRFDRTASTVAMRRVVYLLEDNEDNRNKENIYNQLQIIEDNTPYDWTFLYFMATIYQQFGDTVNAKRVLELAINVLQFEFNNAKIQFTQQLEDNSLDEEALNMMLVPSLEYLTICKKLYLTVCGNDSNKKEIYDSLSRNKNFFAALYFVDDLGFKDICNYFRSDIKNCSLSYEFSRSWGEVPYRLEFALSKNWFYCGEVDIKVLITFNNLATKELPLHPRANHTNPAIVNNSFVRYILDYPNLYTKKSDIKHIEVIIKNSSNEIHLFYDANQLNNIASKGETKIRLPLDKVQYNNDYVNIR